MASYRPTRPSPRAPWEGRSSTTTRRSSASTRATCLGVGLTGLTSEIARRFEVPVENGALVTRVAPNGPAADASIEPGGIIIAVGSERVRGAGDLLSALRRHEPGERVEITVANDEGTREFAVELGREGKRWRPNTKRTGRSGG